MNTWNVVNMQHITPNLKRWDYSDIPGGSHGQIKGPAHTVEGGHHPRIDLQPWAPRQWTFTTTRWRCGLILLPSLTLRSLHPQGDPNFQFDPKLVALTAGGGSSSMPSISRSISSISDSSCFFFFLAGGSIGFAEKVSPSRYYWLEQVCKTWAKYLISPWINILYKWFLY